MKNGINYRHILKNVEQRDSVQEQSHDQVVDLKFAVIKARTVLVVAMAFKFIQ